MEYIIEAKPKMHQLNVSFIEQIYEKLNNDVLLTDDEIKLFLDHFVCISRQILEEKLDIDIINDPLVNRCDLAQHIIGKLLEGKKNITVFPKESQDVFSPTCTGHSFLVCIIQDVPYLVDLTYRQFFLKENCTKDKFFIKDDMVLIAPSPGLFITLDDDGKKIASEIISNGYIKLDANVAKKYGDSFYFTKTGYQEYSDISGNIYLNSLLKENYNYAVTDNRFQEMYGKIL